MGKATREGALARAPSRSVGVEDRVHAWKSGERNPGGPNLRQGRHRAGKANSDGSIRIRMNGCTSDSTQEPGALAAHARICAGGGVPVRGLGFTAIDLEHVSTRAPSELPALSTSECPQLVLLRPAQYLAELGGYPQGGCAVFCFPCFAVTLLRGERVLQVSDSRLRVQPADASTHSPAVVSFAACLCRQGAVPCHGYACKPC
jgi:hypothetical protein